MHLSCPEQAWVRMYRTEARAAQNGKCAYCHEPISVERTTADHVVARRKGGTTRQENIKAACFDCNIAKGHLSEKAFLSKIKNPRPGDAVRIWRAWSRRRIWLATERVCTRIMRMVE